MKKGILLIVMVLFAVEGLYAQNTVKDWYNTSQEKTGVYGAEVDKAYEFLAKKKVKHTPIIAVIGAGVDVEHEALVKNIWTNPKEKADNKDNDGNGLVDDIHGWNFIGQKDGNTMSNIGKVADREWFRLRGKYEGVMFDGKKYFKYVDEKRQDITTPINHGEYVYFRELNVQSEIASMSMSFTFSHYTANLAKELFADLRAKYPNKNRFSIEDLDSLFDANERASRDSLFGMGYTIIHMNAQMTKHYVKDSTYDYMGYVEQTIAGGSQIKKTYENFTKALNAYPTGVRENMIGDSGDDITKTAYGNNVLLTANSAGGTMISTIIAGARGVEGRNNPICSNAQIMPLTIIDQAGEPFLKDIALSIRYAVDHGADIICFSVPNDIFPAAKRVWVEDALQYAEKKGILIVVNALENSNNMDEKTFFPNRFMASGKELTNIMTVSSSDIKGNPLLKSNFGGKSVDLYAPGESILAGYVGDSYQVGSGSILSMAVTAGVAALIKSYYPNLTGSQIRTLLNNNVTSREGVEVEKMVLKKQMVQDMYLFDELCLSKGIINAYNAVKAADKIK